MKVSLTLSQNQRSNSIFKKVHVFFGHPVYCSHSIFEHFTLNTSVCECDSSLCNSTVIQDNFLQFFMKIYEPGHEKMCLMCEQQRHRSACVSGQSDQRLCCSLLRTYNISRVYSRNFKTLGNTQRHVLSCRGSYVAGTY